MKKVANKNDLTLEFVRVTESAAIAAARWIGKGDKNAADGAAVDEMRDRFNKLPFSGRVVIGEGSKDEAPELYTGEKLGTGGPRIDIAVDPLECTESVAYGRPNALSVIVAGPEGSLLSAPDTYMQKIAAGPAAARVIDIDAPTAVNIKKAAAVLGKRPGDITVMLLDRPRHAELIKDIRKAGARVRLITDGDVAAGIATCMPESGIDLLMGIGGSTEAVLAAAAIKILGGELQCRFALKDEHHAELVKKAGFSVKKIYRANDLARGKNVSFIATGVIDGPLLPGVRFEHSAIITHSLVMRGSTGTIRTITAHHSL